MWCFYIIRLYSGRNDSFVFKLNEIALPRLSLPGIAGSLSNRIQTLCLVRDDADPLFNTCPVSIQTDTRTSALVNTYRRKE